MDKKLRIVISGIGNRALPKKEGNSNWMGWVKLIKRSKVFQLVAAHDISEDSIRRIIKRKYLKATQTYTDLEKMLKENPCEAILISNPTDCHAYTIRKALDFNLHLLIEKPFVHDLNEGRKLLNLIEKKRRIATVVQNWRSKDVGRILRRTISAGLLGKIGHIFFRYIRDREDRRYPSYIFEEIYPLLFSMGIHHLDLFRYILNDEFKCVSGQSFKPPWSKYCSDTGVNLSFRTMKGVHIVYSGTISSRSNYLPQETLLIEGENGSLFNESQWLEPPLWFYRHKDKKKINLTQGIKRTSVFKQYNISDEIILNNFYQAIIAKEKPLCTARDSLNTIAALEASRISCESGKVVYLNNLMQWSLLEG